MRKALLVGAIVGATLLGSLPSASADPFGYPPLQTADGSDHWYCRVPTTSDDVPKIDAAMTILDAQTQMTSPYAGATCGTSTDVVWVRADDLNSTIYGDPAAEPLRGYTTCVRWATWGVCDQAWLIYNRLEMFYNTLANTSGADIGPNYDVNVRKTLGHELGHSVGLTHNDGPVAATCSSATAPGPADPMRSGWVVTNTVFHWYNAHHIDCHINPTY